MGFLLFFVVGGVVVVGLCVGVSFQVCVVVVVVLVSFCFVFFCFIFLRLFLFGPRKKCSFNFNVMFHIDHVCACASACLTLSICTGINASI